MNPLLWLNAVTLPLILLGAWLFRGQIWLSLPLILGVLGVPAYTLWEYRYFARGDPQRLQSEGYLIAHQRLMLQSKSSTDPIDAAAIPAGANPELTGFSGEESVSQSSLRAAVVPPLKETDDE
jgi:hypothetical protein